MLKALRSLVRNDDAATLVEYSLVIALIALACIVSIQFLSGKVKALFSDIGNSVGAA